MTQTTAIRMQNWGAIALIAIGLGAAIGLQTAAGLFIAGIGIIESLRLIIARSKKAKSVNKLTILAIICWAYVVLSALLLFVLPQLFTVVYGFDLSGLANWAVSFMYVGGTALALTVVELFRTSNK